MTEPVQQATSPDDSTPQHRYTAELAGRIEKRWQDLWSERGTFNAPNPVGPLAGDVPADKLFVQEGRKVFKEVVPMVSELIVAHLTANGIAPSHLKRLWLHQANLGMNEMIARKVLGRDPVPGEAPNILDEYANTSSAGSVIAFHKYSSDLKAGDIGLLCSFGAGYSAGSVILKKLAA